MASELFIKIYDESFPLLKSISPIHKEAEMIFCEREFTEWLGNKFGSKLTSKSYPKYCTTKYFDLFIPEFNKLKNKKEHSNKRKAILERLNLPAKFPAFEIHEYDIDIVGSYTKVKKLLTSSKKFELGNTKEAYLNSYLFPIEFYCNENKMQIERVFQLNYPIVVDCSNPNFQAHLGRKLIVCDISKISSILSYQKIKWNSDGLFESFVEHLVYSFVLNNCPFDKVERLKRIMDWVEKNRIFISNEASIAEKDGSMNKSAIEAKIEYFYWPYPEEKLKFLYQLLIKEEKIEKTDFFLTNFKDHTDFPSNPIVWKVSNIQLMYLLNLVYKKKAHYKSISIQNIAFKLFKHKNIFFTSKGLNTSLLQASEYNKKTAKLSHGIKSIKDIYDQLIIE